MWPNGFTELPVLLKAFNDISNIRAEILNL